MIAIKTLIFFFALVASISAIEDFVEKILAHSKKTEEDYHHLYTHGLIRTLDFWSTLISILLWTGFYFVNQLA